MAITDATGNVATTWQEQDTVVFTAGTLANEAACVTEVESKLRRGTLGATTKPSDVEVKRWLVRAKEELCEIKNFTWTRRYAYADTVAGTWNYALPPDYHGGEVSLRDLTNDKRLTFLTGPEFDSNFPDPAGESNGEPNYMCVKGRELWTNSPADAVYRYEIEYNRTGDDNTPGDYTYLPELERFRCCDFAVAEAFESIHDFQKSQMFRQKWGVGLQKAKLGDAKQRWGALRYQCGMMGWPKYGGRSWRSYD